MGRRVSCHLFWILTVLAISIRSVHAQPPAAGVEPESPSLIGKFVGEHCLSCHNREEKRADLDLSSALSAKISDHTQLWERVVRKLQARQMPPQEMPRPDESAYAAALATLESTLDSHAFRQPNPGRVDTFKRLTRNEYRNAIDDLFGLTINVTALLPADDSSHGFDNVTVGDLSPTLLNRYITAAQHISRLVIGGSQTRPRGDTIRIRADRTQEEHVEGLPLGTRGGALISYAFPVDGEYEIQIRLARDRDEHVEGLNGQHDLEVLLDRRRLARFTVRRPKRPEDHQAADAHLKTRFQATAGPAKLGVTFLKKPTSLLETKRQPYQAHFNRHRHPRISPAIYEVSIVGPFSTQPTDQSTDPAAQQNRLYRPLAGESNEDAAARILTKLMRRAYRRPIKDDDLSKPMQFFRTASQEEGFDAGLEMAFSSVLINPHFLFRIEQDPPNTSPGKPYTISDLSLASRLSFFLWSSIPDDELLDLASRGELSRPEVLEDQVHRMLADERSESLVNSFAAQWLYLRNLESITPDARLFPDFDDNLRQAMRRETELFFADIVQQDRSVLNLLQADYTFLNERLAKHYGIPHVYGSRFRRVSLPEARQRGGLLRQASILTVTSYATRTSPVIRGHWILKNLLGNPPPPPPDDVPALKDNTVSATLSVRQRLTEHRRNPNCASCHNLMDPIGFALENFDAVGRWRDLEADQPVDASGGLPDGSQFTGVAGLEQGLLNRPELFVGTMTEKLLTFALGRGVELDDAAAVRRIVGEAKANEFRFSSLVLGIARSTPFQMRNPE